MKQSETETPSKFNKKPMITKYLILPSVILISLIVTATSNFWIIDDVHHFYLEILAFVLDSLIAFYCLLRFKALHEKLFFFLGIGFVASALVDVLHASVSIYEIEQTEFLRYFIPQTWVAGRLIDSIMMILVITKFSSELKLTKITKMYKQPSLAALFALFLGISVGSIIISYAAPFPQLLIEFPIHRPYDFVTCILFACALGLFYKKKLYTVQDNFIKGISLFLIVNVFAELMISFSAVNFDTLFNVAHVLKDVGYFILIISMTSSIISQYKIKELLASNLEKSKEQLKLDNEIIQISEKKFHSLYEQSPELLRTVDIDGKILDCNSTYTKSLGYEKSDILGRSFYEHTADKSMDDVKDCFETWKRNGAVKDREIWLKRKNGHEFPVLISAVSIKDENGDTVSSTIIKDITEIHKRNKIIKNQLEDLKQMDIQKEEFATIASHELRTPLTPITGYIEILLNPEMSNVRGEDTKILKKIYRNTKKLEILINRIFLAQKLDKGVVKVHNTEFSLKELTGNVHKAYSSLMKKKNITFVNTTKDDIIINSDSDRIQDIFSNLIQNTLDFVPEYGRIEIGAKIQNSDILYWVKDNGFGIPKEKQDKLFHKFYQVDSSLRRKHEGIGLGLTICKGLVETMGGKIWVDSDEDKGATFYFTIPKSERLKKEMNE